MNNDEAKFILAAYRPGGQDATDALFAEPLSQAKRDPDLNVWFTSQLAFDSAVSAKLRELQPPPGLRDMILAGVRVSSRERTRRRRWYWFAAAAMLVIGLSVLVAVVRSAVVRPELAELTRFALRDTAFDGMEHIASLPAMRDLEARLAETHFRYDTDLDFDLARLFLGVEPREHFKSERTQCHRKGCGIMAGSASHLRLGIERSGVAVSRGEQRFSK